MDIHPTLAAAGPPGLAVIAIAALIQGARDPSLCGGCHTNAFLAVAAVGAAAGGLIAVFAARKK